MKKILFKWILIPLLVMAGFTLSWAGSGDPVLEGKAATALDIDGGTIDNTTIGSSTPNTGVFTTLDTTSNVIVGTSGDPADTGAIRLKNADKIVWEASPTGTDIEGITVDTNEIVQIGATGASGVTITPAVTLGDQLDIGEHDLKLDSLLSVDGKYSGITCDGILGATLAFGDLVYLNTVDQRWELVDADAEATAGDVMLAIVLAAGNDGDTKLLLLQGFIREDDWNFTSYGQALFVSCTAGDITATAPSATSDIVRVIGHASTFADQIYFNPSGTWIEIG